MPIRCDRDNGVFRFIGHNPPHELVGAECPNCGREVVIDDKLWLASLQEYPKEENKNES